MADAGHEPRSALLRIEDRSLLMGAAGFIDDLGAPPGTLHAAIFRSPHAHARFTRLDLEGARRAPGVAAVFGGAELTEISRPLLVGIKVPMECWPMAIERVRYVGEPVAVVIAADRYLAEDAVDLIEAEFEPLRPVVEPEQALEGQGPTLHDTLGGNVCSERNFRYGEPEAAFAGAAREVSISVRYPRNAVTPIETYGLVAEYDPHEDSFDVLANFQGPFSIHPVIARALNVPGNRLRLRTPPASGGSFGVKQGIFPYIVLMAVAARLAGRPVKWIEDRLEHLTASVSATNRLVTLRAAVGEDGRILALDWDQVEDVGAYLRAPEPATLYRMHGNLCGAYDIANLTVRNRLVVTNKTPTGLVRGFGGPQVYFALERLLQAIALELGLDHLDVIRGNLIPKGAFPYRTASGALYDSGDYGSALDRALEAGRYQALLDRQKEVRAAGGLYGVGLAAVVEPSVSNMGYLSIALTPEERAKAGPKNGAQAAASVTIDPVGSVTVQLDSVPQGQGHRTVAAGVVAEMLGLDAEAVRVISTIDTAKDAWSIAAGNYSSRFAAASAGAVSIATGRLRQKLARVAAAALNARPEDIRFADGRVFPTDNPDAGMGFARLASLSHWAPGALPDDVDQAVRETAYWSPPELTAPTEDDCINSSLCHGFIFDFCGVEVDRATGHVRVERYVTMHDCGRVLHEPMVEGQIRGGFSNALGAALYEEYAYDAEGAFLAGTFADYPVPTVAEMPPLEILHIETASPFTPLGAKGVGEGNCMSTPVCIANAVADAFAPELGRTDLTLPLAPARLRGLIGGPEPAPPAGREQPKSTGDRGLRGQGTARVETPREEVWALLMDPDALARVVPGAHSVKKHSAHRFTADVTLGVGPVRGRYRVQMRLSDLDPPESALLSGRATGSLGGGEGSGRVMLEEDGPDATIIRYEYEAKVGGKVAAVGGRMLDGAARIVIGQFFQSLGRQAGGGGSGWLQRLRARIGR